MNDASGDEAGWLAAALAGDPQAFERLVLAHQGAVRALMRRVAGDPASADDIAQCAFIAAWQKLHGFRGGSFRAWVCTIAYRLHARQRAHNRVVPADPCAEAAPSPNAEARRIDIDRAIAALPQAQREAILLGFVGGMSHGEIADATGWPIGTVKSHIHRAKQQLRAQLETYSDD